MKQTLVFITLVLFIKFLNAQEHKEYYDNGNLKKTGHYLNGYKTGEWKSYHKNGKLSEIGKWYGVKIDEWKYYNENGELERTETYYTDGQLRSIGGFKNMKRTGEWNFYYENGQLSATGNYKNGSPTGEQKVYFESGQLKEIGEIEDWKRIGEWKYYNEMGELTETKSYKDGNVQKTNTFIKTKDESKASKTYDKPIHLTDKTFKELIFNYETDSVWNYKGDLPCIIDFYADWCKPCKMLAPILEDLSKEYSGKIIVYKLNVQHNNVSSAFGITNIPAVLFIPKKGRPSMNTGLESKEYFKDTIDKLLLDNK